jgi:hypothetical protein
MQDEESCAKDEQEQRVRVIILNRELREKERSLSEISALSDLHSDLAKKTMLRNSILELKAFLREATRAQQATQKTVKQGKISPSAISFYLSHSLSHTLSLPLTLSHSLLLFRSPPTAEPSDRDADTIVCHGVCVFEQ